MDGFVRLKDTGRKQWTRIMCEMRHLPSFSVMIEWAWVQSAASITKSLPLIPKIVSIVERFVNYAASPIRNSTIDDYSAQIASNNLELSSECRMTGCQRLLFVCGRPIGTKMKPRKLGYGAFQFTTRAINTISSSAGGHPNLHPTHKQCRSRRSMIS